jgi:hypothetical protein
MAQVNYSYCFSKKCPAAVARKLGLSPTDERAGGEIIWRS